MKTVYFVRHGQTRENIEKLHQGPDGPLTELGLSQSAFIAERAAKLPVQGFISSPYKRARQTADLIAKKIGKEPEYSDLFVESRGLSKYFGVSESDPESAAVYKTIRAQYGPGYRFGDEEGYDDHTARAKAALEFLANRPEERILVVTHGLFLRILLAHVIFNMQPTAKEVQSITWNIDTPRNTSLTLFTHDADRAQPWRLWVWNDHAHLAD